MSENNKNENDYSAVQHNQDIFIIRSEGVAKPATWTCCWGVLPARGFCQIQGTGTWSNGGVFAYLLASVSEPVPALKLCSKSCSWLLEGNRVTNSNGHPSALKNPTTEVVVDLHCEIIFN